MSVLKGKKIAILGDRDGIPGMAIMLKKTLPEAAMLGMAFLPGDILKAVLAGFVTQGIARMRPGSLLSRA